MEPEGQEAAVRRSFFIPVGGMRLPAGIIIATGCHHLIQRL
jgi:hypothetical protein